MTRRFLISLLCMVFGLALIGVLSTGLTITHAQEGGQEPDADSAVLRGSVVFAEFCAACHGSQGEAIGTGPAFASIRNYDPASAKDRITTGYDSDRTTPYRMIGYGKDADGPFTETQIDDVLAYMATWNAGEGATPPLPEPHLEPGDVAPAGSGSPENGAVVYAYSCLGCHGLNAQGRDLENFPSFPLDEDAVRIAATGDRHGFVSAFADNAGGPLSSQQLEDLGAYLRTIGVEEEEEGPQGVSILLMVLGLGAVGVVGGVYLAATRQGSQNKS